MVGKRPTATLARPAKEPYLHACTANNGGPIGHARTTRRCHGRRRRAQVDDQISYTSQPDRVAIFLNNVAYARDEVALPGGVDVSIVLPPTVYPDTLVLRENGKRVPNYRLNSSTGQPTIKWQCATDSELRDISMEYLLGGVSWRPTYDMWVGADTDETVELDYFAEITDSSLDLDDVETQLVAGMVDLNRPIAPAAELSPTRSSPASTRPTCCPSPHPWARSISSTPTTSAR